MHFNSNWEKRIRSSESKSLQSLEGEEKRLSEALSQHQRTEFFNTIWSWLAFLLYAIFAICFLAFCISGGAPLSEWKKPTHTQPAPAPKAWMTTSWTLIAGMYIYEIWLLHQMAARKSAYGAMRACYGLIAELEAPGLRWNLTKTRAGLAQSVESMAQHVEQVSKTFSKKDANLRTQLMRESIARADHLRAYKLWLYSPMETTRSDLAKELTECLGHMIAGEWLALPSCRTPREPKSIKDRLRHVALEAVPLAFSILLIYFSKDLGPFAAVATPLAGVIVLQFLTRRDLATEDVSKASSMFTFKDR